MLETKTIVPLYVQLMNKLKQDIQSGVYKPGEQLLPELSMAQEHSVSVVTVRKAVNELVSQGLIEKKQGKGTFVAMPKYERDYTRIMSFTESCRMMGLTAGSRTMQKEFLVPPDPQILQDLALPPETKVVYIKRLRLANGEPMVIEETYYSDEYSFLLNASLDGSLFELLRDKAGTQVVKSRKRIDICRASYTEAKALNVRKNSPLLCVRSVAYQDDGSIVYAGTQLINGERISLYI